jgi:hypothetical protein
MKFASFSAILMFFIPATLFANPSKPVTLQFGSHLTAVESCILDTLRRETPFPVKYLEVTGPLEFGINNELNEIERRIELPVLLLTTDNHPAYMLLRLVSSIDHIWGKVTTGGRPIFVTPAMEKNIDVVDSASGNRAYSITQNCLDGR